MIEVNHLTKMYGSFKAVDDISFKVEKGEILGFLGPNGAGKSTTMKMLSCFITPTSGTAKIVDKDILSESLEAREKTGYLPESAPSYKNMTVTEFLNFIASVRGFEGKEKEDRVNKIIETTSLERARLQTIDTLSKGYRQRVGFAQALLHDPPVLILDEPTDGLDPNQKKEVRNLIRAMSRDKAIILSTHILEEMEAVCTRAIIIDRGKIVANGSPAELLKESSMYNVVTVKTRQPLDAKVKESISALPDVHDVRMEEAGENGQTRVQVVPRDKADVLDAVKAEFAKLEVEVEEIYREKGFMDEVFWNLTKAGRS